jgi:hypothetical protein
LAAVALAGCGGGSTAAKGGLGWKGEPIMRVSSATGARVLLGTVKNESSRELRIRAPDVRLVDQHGRRIRSSAAFASSFVRSLIPQNGRPGSRKSEFPEAEQRRIGYLAVLRSGETVPLTLSWNEPAGPRTAKRIVYGAGSLPVPATLTYGR